MTKKYSIESTAGVTIVRFSKMPEFEDLCDAIDDVTENYPSELRLWDLSSGLNLTNSQIEQLAKYGKSKFRIPSKVAIVAPTDLAYGLLRMYDVYRQDELAEVMVFRTEQEARVWLNSPINDPRDL